jgi:hypothetical protein
MINSAKKIFELLRMFVEGKISATEFEGKYISLWRKMRDSGELSSINSKTDDALDKLFTAVDAYCSYETLRDDNDIDENQLLEVAKQTFNTIESAIS